MNRKVEGTPTIIRLHSKPDLDILGGKTSLTGIVTTVITSQSFTAFFHVYRVHANARTTLVHSGGLWTAEKGAVDQFDEWVKSTE
jgi:hypothetical protein